MRHHSIDYIEFSSTDLARTKQFFAAAFGWTFTDYGDEYVGIHKVAGEGESGGMCKVDSVATGGPLVILYSDHLEASYEAVVAAGGKISKEIISFPGGRRFQFLDPDGTELAVWTQA